MQVRFALDVSLRSLGAAVRYTRPNQPLDTATTTVALLGYGKKRVELVGTAAVGGAVRLTVLRAPDERAPDVERYTYIADSLFATLVAPALVGLENVESSVEVTFEGYAFVPERAGSSYKLHELTGILKQRFYAAGVRKQYTAASSAWRKAVLGNARADKRAALAFFEKAYPETDVFAALGKKRGEHVPSPIQDMVEAYCILQYNQQAAAMPAKLAPAKRKRTRSPSANLLEPR